MKTLNLHVDYIEWEGLKKALKNIDDLGKQDISKKRVEEVLVILIAVEKNDLANNYLLGEFVQNTKSILEQIKTKKVVLYPYAHLSRELGNPSKAMEILDELEKRLKKEKLGVFRAPFGYYKSFELKVKGHPLSELSREIIMQENEEDLTDKEISNLLKQISKSVLDTSKLKENDHRIIGRKMNLWSFNPVAPGMVFWHDKGLHLKNKLIEYWRELHKNSGYEEISTPQIMDKKLWEISGHWSKYKENNFSTKYENRDFLIKPMNCPGGMLIYKSTPKTYKDLPLRVGELGIVHRVELSGVLAGLFRVIQFTQDDAHVYCTEKQIKAEIGKIIDLTLKIYNQFNLKIKHIELSTRPEKRIGSDKVWDITEKILEEVLKEKKVKYKINKGDGAFYGPKIDYHIEDSLGRTWQLGTIQLDMALPERFDLNYIDGKGKEKKPIMLHRTIYGSLERFLGIITESYNGKFPLWLSPNQIKILTMNDSVNKYAKEVYNKLFETGFRVEFDDKTDSIGKKVREASIERFNYLVTIGEDEQKEKVLAIKKPGEKEIIKMKLDEFIGKLEEEVEGKN
ncbi:MAG: threonine--tRNA ligase [Nanoarchaeota archaeon]|nr:threonine--tRNA ligase [Nanoarchaeota archaeon]